MANTLGVYNPIFYANEALILLENALGMGNRVHRGFEAERNSFERGEVINIRKPSTFTAQDAPSSDQNVTTETVPLTLAFWKEVKFSLSDKELAFTGDRIIEDHIQPAAYALADFVDVTLAGLYKDVPWFHDLEATTAVTDITGVKRVQFDNKVPQGQGQPLHYMIGGALQEGFENLTAFTQWQGQGPEAASAQRTGHLGNKYGYELFANQNVQTHTKGTIDDLDCLTVGTPAVGATTITFDAVSLAGTVVPGDSFVIAGNTQRYAITNTVTAASNAFTGVTFTPALAAAPGDGIAVTVRAETGTENLAFHRNAFALAMAPLPQHGQKLGAQVKTIQDQTTGLSIRSRMFYDGDNSKVKVALDILFGVKTLDPNLACRGSGA